MARHIKEETTYKVTLHKNGAYRYASTRPRIINEAGKKNSNKSIHWGTVTEDLKFMPYTKFIYLPVEERKKFVFPEDWDLSELDKLSSEKKAGRPVSSEDDTNRLYGATWFLERAAEITGIREDLEKVFGNKDIVDDIMTLAMYPYITNFSYSRLARWQLIEKTPSKRILAPCDITRLTQTITEKHRMELLKLRAARLSKEELCCVDSTSRSAYGESLTDIRWGHNKEGLALPQTLEVVIYTLNEHMPIYYRTFPGNMPDARSIETIMTDVEHAGFHDLVFITDKGYTSIQNIEKYILKDQRAIMCVKVNLKFVLDRIKKLGNFSAKPDGMDIDIESRLYYKQYDLDYEVKSKGETIKKADRMKLNLYFNSMLRGEQQRTLDIKIAGQEQSLDKAVKDKEEIKDKDSFKNEHNFYEIEFNVDGTVKSYRKNQKKYDEATITMGFIANVTLKLDISAPVALASYKIRDEQEKYFQQMKSEMNSNRQRNWSEDGKTGRLFILFISMILGSHVRHVWKSTELKKKFDSSLDIIDEMRSIRCIEHKGHAKFITPFVGTQVDICKAFGFEIPKGCEPTYKSKKTGKKRGRPRKEVVDG